MQERFLWFFFGYAVCRLEYVDRSALVLEDAAGLLPAILACVGCWFFVILVPMSLLAWKESVSDTR